MAAPTDAELARLARKVARRLLARREHLSTAESCTGGFVAKLLTDIAGSSDWFESGVVCYSNAAKRRQLGVPAELLRRHGAVSRAVAKSMALGLLNRDGTERTIAVTGIAGPSGGTSTKPVGTVWFGFARQSKSGPLVSTVQRRFRGGRDAIRRRSVAFVLRRLIGK